VATPCVAAIYHAGPSCTRCVCDKHVRRAYDAGTCLPGAVRQHWCRGRAQLRPAAALLHTAGCESGVCTTSTAVYRQPCKLPLEGAGHSNPEGKP